MKDSIKDSILKIWLLRLLRNCIINKGISTIPPLLNGPEVKKAITNLDLSNQSGPDFLLVVVPEEQ